MKGAGCCWRFTHLYLTHLHLGLAASAIVVMLIDLLGDGRRGVAVGILECTLYVTVALWAFLGEALIQGMGVRDPFWIGMFLYAAHRLNNHKR